MDTFIPVAAAEPLKVGLSNTTNDKHASRKGRRAALILFPLCSVPASRGGHKKPLVSNCTAILAGTTSLELAAVISLVVKFHLQQDKCVAASQPQVTSTQNTSHSHRTHPPARCHVVTVHPFNSRRLAGSCLVGHCRFRIALLGATAWHVFPEWAEAGLRRWISKAPGNRGGRPQLDFGHAEWGSFQVPGGAAI